MARRRYISTDISIDSKVNAVAKQSDFAVLFYTWLIPHAEDDAILRGNPEEIMAKVIPLRREKTQGDVITALTILHEAKLITWNTAENAVYFPPQAFYKYQTYISTEKRRVSHPIATSLFCAENAEEQRETAKNTASPSPSPSLSLSPSVKEEKTLMSVKPDDAVKKFMDEYNQTFSDLWAKPLKLTKDRRNKISARLKTYSLDDLLKAMWNLRKSEFHCGQNDKGMVYATPEFLCRNDGMVDKWMSAQARASPMTIQEKNRLLLQEEMRNG